MELDFIPEIFPKKKVKRNVIKVVDFMKHKAGK
jgi:hypothetical protein